MRTVGLSLAVLSARAPLAAELCGGGFVIAADALPLVVCGERGQCVLLITHILLLLYLFVLGGLVDLLGPLRVRARTTVRVHAVYGLLGAPPLGAPSYAGQFPVCAVTPPIAHAQPSHWGQSSSPGGLFA